MRLIVGGKNQGKREYAMAQYGLTEADFARSLEEARTKKALCAAHEAVADCLRRGEEPQGAFRALLAENPGLIILCDELGCGVVPIEPFDRAWREAVGRLCVALAQEAESVERILCGLPMRLK